MGRWTTPPSRSLHRGPRGRRKGPHASPRAAPRGSRDGYFGASRSTPAKATSPRGRLKPPRSTRKSPIGFQMVSVAQDGHQHETTWRALTRARQQRESQSHQARTRDFPASSAVGADIRRAFEANGAANVAQCSPNERRRGLEARVEGVALVACAMQRRSAPLGVVPNGREDGSPLSPPSPRPLHPPLGVACASAPSSACCHPCGLAQPHRTAR
eukprot:3828082-Pyramimonas_sp.AAC.1